jgi:hypothetical protein
MGEQNTEPVTNDTTVFGQDRSGIDYQPGNLSTYRQAHVKNMVSIHDQESIKAFLQKPLFVNSYSVSTGATAGATLATIPFPWNGTWADPSPWKNKLQGFLGFRGDLEFIIRCNASRFAQGMLLVHYLPAASASPDDTNGHLVNLTTRSQLPNVILNVNKDTEIRFRVPYVAPADFCNLENQSAGWGNLYITHYLPFKDPNATTVQIDVYASLHDVELAIPTFVTVQSNVADKEHKPSMIAKKAAKIAKGFKHVPMLSSVAGTAEWALDATSKALAAFGYASAAIETEPTRVHSLANPYILNYDGADTGIGYGLSSRNKLDVLPGFAGFEHDEMAIESIVARSTYYRSGSWAVSDVTGTNIMSFNHGPATFKNTFTGSGSFGRTWVTNTPLSFIESFGQYWRGSIVYTIRLAKTEFHTGLLEFLFRPTASGTTGAMTQNQSMFTFRHILDMTQSDTFVIEVPYMALTPWTSQGGTIGEVRLNIINPLRCPANVDQTVDMLVEVAGGSDFEIAGMSNVMWVPHMSADFTPASNENQSTGRMDTRTIAGVVGGAHEAPMTLDHNRYCMGEKITSVKQLISRSTKLINPSNTAGTFGPFTNVLQQITTFKPSVMGGSYFDNTLGAWRDHPLSGDWFCSISSCYALWRGSVRMRIRSPVRNQPFAVTWTGIPATGLQSDWTNAPTTSGLVKGYATGNYYFHDQTSPLASVTFPQYTKGHSEYASTVFNKQLAATKGATLPARAQTTYERNTYAKVFAPGGTYTTYALEMYRAAGEDVSLGFFIGVPAMVDVSLALDYDSLSTNF